MAAAPLPGRHPALARSSAQLMHSDSAGDLVAPGSACRAEDGERADNPHHTTAPSGVAIHVAAGSDGGCSISSISSDDAPPDCTVQLELGGRPVKVRREKQRRVANGPATPALPRPAPAQVPGGTTAAQQQQQPPPPRAAWRRRLLCGGLGLALALVAVLVPVWQVLGLQAAALPDFQLLRAPAPSHRLLFAYEGQAARAAPADALPPALAAQVTHWVVLPSSGLHVATFGSGEPMQRALAALAASEGLRYAVADFELLPDRRASKVVDPDELWQLSQLAGRQLLGAEPRGRRSSSSRRSSRRSSSRRRPQQGGQQALGERLATLHRARLAERRQRRVPGQQAEGARLPATARRARSAAAPLDIPAGGLGGAGPRRAAVPARPGAADAQRRLRQYQQPGRRRPRRRRSSCPPRSTPSAAAPAWRGTSPTRASPRRRPGT